MFRNRLCDDWLNIRGYSIFCWHFKFSVVRIEMGLKGFFRPGHFFAEGFDRVRYYCNFSLYSRFSHIIYAGWLRWFNFQFSGYSSFSNNYQFLFIFFVNWYFPFYFFVLSLPFVSFRHQFFLTQNCFPMVASFFLPGIRGIVPCASIIDDMITLCDYCTFWTSYFYINYLFSLLLNSKYTFSFWRVSRLCLGVFRGLCECNRDILLAGLVGLVISSLSSDSK